MNMTMLIILIQQNKFNTSEHAPFSRLKQKKKRMKRQKIQHTCTFFHSSVSEQWQRSGEGTNWTDTVWYRDNGNPRDLHPIHTAQQFSYIALIKRIFCSYFLVLRESNSYTSRTG